MIVGETQLSCFQLAKDFAGYLKGKNALDIEQRLQELDYIIAGNYTAKRAFDIALYDIAAQHAGKPLYAFLGGTNKQVESDLTIGIDTPERMRDQAIDFVRNGVTMIKVKLGKKPQEDIQRMKLIREAVGSQIKLRIDATRKLFKSESLNVADTLESYLQYQSFLSKLNEAQIAETKFRWIIAGNLWNKFRSVIYYSS